MHVYNSTLRECAYRLKKFAEQKQAAVLVEGFLRTGEGYYWSMPNVVYVSPKLFKEYRNLIETLEKS